MRHLWIVLLGTALLLTSGVSLLVASARFRFVHPEAPHLHFEVTRDGQVKLKADEQGRFLLGDGEPRVEIHDVAWDFGVMNPHTIGEHVFQIRNVGTGDLWLRNEGTTCKCTLASMPKGVLRPGESAPIALQWNTGDTPNYSHSATIRTNDPARPLLELRVYGRVLRVCQSQPAELHFASIAPQAGASGSVLVYSHVWNELHVLAGRAGLSQVTWHTEPASAEELAAVNARAGVRVIVDLADDLPTGVIQDILSLDVAPSKDGSDSIEWTIPLGGHKLGRFALFGTGLTESGQLDMGFIERGQSASRRLVLRLREHELPKAAEFTVTAQPGWLRVDVSERVTSNDSAGLYDVTLTVPADAPPCAFRGVESATVTLSYPGGAAITLEVRLAVVDSR